MSEDPGPGNSVQIKDWAQNAPFTTISLKDDDNVEDEPMCRICHETGGNKRGKRRLIQPCLCSGTLGNVHKACIERWLTVTRSDKCTICCFTYKTKKVLKPIRQWIWPPMTTEDIAFAVISIFIHLTVFTQMFCLIYICFHYYYDEFPTVLGVAVAGLVTGMPWTFFIVIAMDFNLFSSQYWKVFKATNQRVKLIVDDLKFYHDANTLQQ